MPPEDEKQPPSAELNDLLETLTGSLETAQQNLNSQGGEIKMRRLNRREYNNTIRDLFGFELNPHDIPENSESETFDTVGEDQFFTSAHFEKYLTLGREIADLSIKTNTTSYKESTIRRTQPETDIVGNLLKKVAEFDRKKALIEAGKSWKESGFKDQGEKEILFRQWETRVERPRNYIQYPQAETGVYLSSIVKTANVAAPGDPRADYLIRIRGGLHNLNGKTNELRKIVSISDSDRILGTLKLRGTTENPESAEMPVRQLMGQNRISLKVSENTPKSTNSYFRKIAANTKASDPNASIWIDWLEIEGPFYPEKRPIIEEILYPDTPTGKGSAILHRDHQALNFIQQFTYHAFRRKTPDPAYIKALHDHFKEQRAAGIKYRESMAEVISIILSSPGFLFIQEAAPAQDSPHPELTSRELAIRLSYFLWSSPPDEELYASDLKDPAQYSAQIDRLLDDPKARAFRDGFIDQWAELDRYDAITIDDSKYYRFNEALQRDAKREVQEFFGTLIEENLPTENLIHSNFVTVNAALANHYDLPFPATKTNEFQKISLPENSPRGGLITQTAFLVAGSNGERSSPVIRGALVMEKILNDKPSPPPPNVPELGSATKEPKTNREMVILHQSQPVCSSCHKVMDIIGFGLENFDTIGRWRETETVGKKEIPIQPGGTLPGGQSFANVRDLKRLLLTQTDPLAHQLTESFLTYALGRRIEFSDQPEIKKILEKTKQENYPTRTLIKEVALSPLFKK